MKKKIAITIRSFGADPRVVELLHSHFMVSYWNRTGKRLSEDDLCSTLKDVTGVIAGTEPFSRKVIDAAKKLKVISRVGVGTDNIDLQAVKARQITVMTTPDSPSQAVAEHTIALLLDVLKRVSLYNSALRQEDYSTHAARLLMGQRCGIIGMGRIGKKVAHLLLAFGCDVSYFDPGVSIQSDRGIKKSNTINELVQTSEIITLHASGRSDNKPIITKSIIQNAKNDLVIINTARGSLIDEKALIWGLRNKKVVGAGLDVFPKEPYHGPLLSFSQVVATPHVASNTIESRLAMEYEATKNLMLALGIDETGG